MYSPFIQLRYATITHSGKYSVVAYSAHDLCDDKHSNKICRIPTFDWGKCFCCGGVCCVVEKVESLCATQCFDMCGWYDAVGVWIL